MEVYRLEIREGGKIQAPEGLVPVLTVNGVIKDIQPGIYIGDVRISLRKKYDMPPVGMMAMLGRSLSYQSAATYEDGKLDEEKSVPEAFYGGKVSDDGVSDAYLACSAEQFNGILLTGDAEYNINNVRMDFDGRSNNDFAGVGAGIATFDKTRVNINNCDISLTSVARCALHVGGESNVTVNDSTFINMSPEGPWLDSFSWGCGFLGTNRLTQLTDKGSVLYNNCYLKSNGWGLLSIDGGHGVKMYVKDSKMDLSGPMGHGYGAFCIGTNTVTLDHTHADVTGYPLMVMGDFGKAAASVINGSVLKSRRFGIMVHKDENSAIAVKDSTIDSQKACICIKGSASTFDISNSRLNSKDGVIVQMMDTDEKHMTTADFKIPVGVLDVRKPDRILDEVRELEDVIFNISGCEITGDFYNSTTEIRAFENSTEGDAGPFMQSNGLARQDGLDDPPGGPVLPPPPEEEDMGLSGDDDMRSHGKAASLHNGDDLQGSKNLVINLAGSTVVGVISAATQKYRDGLVIIDESNRLELSNITQTAARPVNNGVIVSLDEASRWIVTGRSYLTRLEIKSGAEIRGAEGKAVKMTVNGEETPVAPGMYRGIIELDCV